MVRRVVRRLVGIGFHGGVLTACLCLPAEAQTTPSYGGRPFVLISRTGVSDPVAGFINGFGRAQVVGDSVAFVVRSFADVSGVFRGRGGPVGKVTGVGTLASDIPLAHFHDGFVRDTTTSDEVAIVAGATQTDAILLTDGTTFATLLPSGTIRPNSGDQEANVIGEPHLPGGNLAVIAWHALPGGAGVDFRGVYRVSDGALETVADTATELPGDFGVPDTFSNQVGFDGETLAFWASRGPFAETEGMFVQAGDGTLTKIAGNGDALPGGGTIDGLISPPVVSGGTVFFFAWDASFATRLLKHEAGSLTVLAQDGDSTAEGEALQNLGQFGLAVEDDRVFFPALTTRGAGLYVLDDGALQTIIPPGTAVGGILPTALVLHDVADGTVVVEATSFSNRRLLANLAAPALPVIVESPAAQTVAAGARVALRVTALGDDPLTYVWKRGGQTIEGATTDTLVIESASATDMGYYQAIVSNPLGTAHANSALLNVEVAPIITESQGAMVIEVGDQLTLRVTAAGGLPLTYTWKRDGEEVVNDSPALGVFVSLVATPADAGRYTVTVSNAFGQATSAAMDVTVNPAAPNPVYAGGRFIPVLSDETLIPGTDTPFFTQHLGVGSVRFFGGGMAFVGGPEANPAAEVHVWNNGAITRLLGADEPLANGLGIAGAYGLIASGASGPLAVSVTQLMDGYQQPVGLYQFDEAGLTVLADTTMAAPGADGALFPTFWVRAQQAGGRTFFTTKIGDVSWGYLADTSGVAPVVSSEEDLPVVRDAAIQFQGLAYDGTDYVLVAATSGLQEMAALRGTPGDEVTKVLAKGDPLPDSDLTVGSIGAPAMDGGAVYLLVYDNLSKPHIVEWRDGVTTRIASAGMEVSGLGTILSLDTSFPMPARGRCHPAVWVTTPEGNTRGIVAAGRDGIEPVLFSNKLDARRVQGSHVIAVEDHRLLVLVDFVGGSRAVYANVGPVDDAPPRLEFTRVDDTTLRLTAPGGTRLEATDTLETAWQVIVGTGDIRVDTTSGTRFFRLTRE